MKVQLKREDLKKTIKLAKSFVANYSNIEVIENILIKTSSEKLIVRATNGEQNITLLIKCNIIEQGKVACSPDKIYSFINSINSEDIKLISKDDNKLKIKAENNYIEIKSMITEDFLIAPEYNNRLKRTLIDRKKLILGIERINYIVSKKSMDQRLTGLCIKKADKDITMVGIDSNKIIWVQKINVDPWKLFKNDVLIHKKNMSKIKRVIKEFPLNSVEVSMIEDSRICFKGIFDNVSFMVDSVLLDLSYPDHTKAKVFRDDKIKASTTVNINKMKNLIKRSKIIGDVIRILVKDDMKIVGGIFSEDDGEFSTKVENKYGELDINVPLKPIINFISCIRKTSNADRVEIEQLSVWAIKLTALWDENSNLDDYVYAVMPYW